ncbi:MAG: dihydrofolate reductase family protein [Dethiosulfatibacter sp.]|nr:dihydrofolate reductase family protein [Dethiosulfatibacter sp.]
MRKVILYIAMSLDGYIADKIGGVDFLVGDGSEPDNTGSYLSFIETIDTIIMGYTTYHQIVTELSPNEWVYKGKKTYVLTSKDEQSTDEIIFTSFDLKSLLNKLKSDDGKSIWICGGASIVNQALDLIDQFCITIIPTILGDGIPLFAKRKNELPVKLVTTKQYNGIIDLIYERRL